MKQETKRKQNARTERAREDKKPTLILATVAALELLVAHLALVVLRVNVLALDLQVLANDGLLAHRARVLFRVCGSKRA